MTDIRDRLTHHWRSTHPDLTCYSISEFVLMLKLERKTLPW